MNASFPGINGAPMTTVPGAIQVLQIMIIMINYESFIYDVNSKQFAIAKNKSKITKIFFKIHQSAKLNEQNRLICRLPPPDLFVCYPTLQQ